MNAKNEKIKVTPSTSIADLLAKLEIEPKQGESLGVNLSLSLMGEISKGLDYESAQTCNALGMLDVARCLAMAGCTRESALAYMTSRAITEEPLKDNVETIALSIVEDFKLAMQSLPKAARMGKRTGSFTIQAI